MERFIRTCSEDFLAELRINPVHDIGKLNESLFGWIECVYNKSPHEGLGNSTPLEAWENSLRSGITPKYVTPVELANAFLHHDKRKVNTYGVISFESNTYEVDAALIGETVLIRYDPMDLGVLYVYHNDRFACAAKPVDLSRTQHSQYKNVRTSREFEPKTNIDYPALMAEHHRKMIEEISKELVLGNHSAAAFDVANPDETESVETHAAEAGEDLARPGFTVREKENGLTKEDYFGVMAAFLGRENLAYHQKELLHKHYDDFRIFNKPLLEKTLSKLRSEFPDAGDNLLFYLNTIKATLDEA